MIANSWINQLKGRGYRLTGARNAVVKPSLR
jgi:hypothetical protein